MAPGILKLLLGSAKGDTAQFCGPEEQLYCVIAVGSTRYRSAAVSPSSPVWHEQFRFTVADDSHMFVECWKGSAQGETQLATTVVELEPVCQKPQDKMKLDLMNGAGLYVFSPLEEQTGSRSGPTSAAPPMGAATGYPAAPMGAPPAYSPFSNPYAPPGGGP
eukprot:CAMPEP_0177619494 /NCGR_PEP_ID=MMETSP0419_2-20121207/26304_1 /TAXON_ID=582737 /ORGANISM="Tetraselmis sp., Strain GSL018" /LENGTH=161 /DNA_ID=CAMNT_0019118793 /DNA_START=180 /DNA_END=661 /DNA_ORIENTATION=-